MLTYSVNTSANHDLIISNSILEKDTSSSYIQFVRGNGIDKRIIANKSVSEKGSVEDIYKVFNLFLSTRNIKTHNYLYSQMLKFKEYADGYMTHQEFTVSSRKLVENILSYPELTPEAIEEWVKESVPIPSSIDEVYDGSKEGVYSREKTYLRHEYVGLATVSIVIKMLSAIMLIYTARIKDDYRNREFLLAEKLLPESFRNYDGYVKLYSFTEITAADELKNEISADTLFAGAVTEDNRLDYVFTAILIPKLLASLCLSVTDKNHLLTFIHKFIKSKAESTSKQKRMKEKTLTQENSNDENDSSGILEAFRPRNNPPLSTYAYYAFTCRSEYILPRLNPELPFNKSLYNKIRIMLGRSDLLITSVHHDLIWLVLHSFISRESLNITTPIAVKELIALTYTLIVKDHPMLATLLLTSPIVVDDNEVLSSSVVSIVRLPKLITEEILGRFTNLFDIPSKKKSPVIDLIDNFTTSVLANVWEFTFDTTILPNTDHIEGNTLENSIVKIPSNIGLVYYELIRDRNKYKSV